MAEQITPRNVDYSQWYLDIVLRAELADYSPVKGCMVIRPRGYALWEKIHAELDARFKATGHQNAYFPLLIPSSFLKREAEHVEGFAPECAVVTIGGNETLEEPLVIRPTSETIIWSMYKKWIQSYRDLPLLINQWANVLRWEKRTRLFLRTTEFLWQEGHTAHETEAEAAEETLKMLFVYKSFVEEVMAIPVIAGIKTESEKFAGAVQTYSIEAMMQDGKALQAGTSHNLGQNFAKAFEVTFQTRKGGLDYVWATSWGVSTRLIGALIMTHSDDKGLVLPPRLAPTKVRIVPIYKTNNRAQVLPYAQQIIGALREDQDLSVDLDDDDQTSPGYKFAQAELLGIPIRLEIGPKEVQNEEIVLTRRDTGEKSIVKRTACLETIKRLLEEIQNNLYQRALIFRKEHIFEAKDYADFVSLMEREAGFVHTGWCADPACEEQIKNETKATIRVIPLGQETPKYKKCLCCGKEAKHDIVVAKAY